MNNNTSQIKITTLNKRNIIMKDKNATPKYLRPKELAEYLQGHLRNHYKFYRNYQLAFLYYRGPMFANYY